MSMIYRDIYDSLTQQQVATVRITGETDIELFKELVRRATNCWDTAPPQVKEFADLVTNGEIFQKYEDQHFKGRGNL